MTNQEDRKLGGTCMADSIRNLNANNQDYVSLWVEKKRKQNGIQSKIESYASHDGFVIVCNGSILAEQSLNFVETKRRENYNAFGEWLVDVFKINELI